MRYKVTVNTSHYPKDVPFEVPEGWVWTTIAEISSSINYGVSESAKVTGKYRLLRITDIQDGKVSWESVPFTDYPEDKAKAFELSDGDILFARTGATVGKSYLVEAAPNNAIFASYLIRVQYSHSVIPQYIKFFFESGYYWEQISSNSVGVGQPNVNGTSLGKLRIPLPPAAEQKRISKEAHRWMGVIDRLEFEAQHLSEDIGAFKSKILDLAIHGKLVSQDSSDEPAINLLRRINPGFQPSHNLHYEGVLPNRWSIIRLGDVIDVISGTSYQKTDIVPTDSGIRILRGGNIQNGMIVLCEDDVFVNHRLSDKHLSLYRGDIALVASTGSRELIGKAAIAKRDYQNTQIGAFLRIIRPKATELSDYLGILFQSDYYKKHIQEAAKGTNINNIKTSYLTEFVVPLPPIKEQQRIIEKVNALFLILNHMANLSDC